MKLDKRYNILSKQYDRFTIDYTEKTTEKSPISNELIAFDVSGEK